MKTLKTLKVLIAGRGGDSGGGLGLRARARANRSALESIFDPKRISDVVEREIYARNRDIQLRDANIKSHTTRTSEVRFGPINLRSATSSSEPQLCIGVRWRSINCDLSILMRDPL